MARPLRIDIEDGVYHVTSRGWERRDSARRAGPAAVARATRATKPRFPPRGPSYRRLESCFRVVRDDRFNARFKDIACLTSVE